MRALNVRTSHVHMVLLFQGDEEPRDIMAELKARATRYLRRDNLVPRGMPIWTRGGNCRLLLDTGKYRKGCPVYVLEQQGARQGIAGSSE